MSALARRKRPIRPRVHSRRGASSSRSSHSIKYWALFYAVTQTSARAPGFRSGRVCHGNNRGIGGGLLLFWNGVGHQLNRRGRRLAVIFGAALTTRVAPPQAGGGSMWLLVASHWAASNILLQPRSVVNCQSA